MKLGLIFAIFVTLVNTTVSFKLLKLLKFHKLHHYHHNNRCLTAYEAGNFKTGDWGRPLELGSGQRTVFPNIEDDIDSFVLQPGCTLRITKASGLPSIENYQASPNQALQINKLPERFDDNIKQVECFC